MCRITFNACKAPRANGRTQAVRHSGGIQALALRMKSVKNIAKITKATQMVAVSKLKGAERRLIAARPLTNAMADLFGKLQEDNEFAPKSQCIVSVTSDKGLCGGVNTGAVRHINQTVLPPLEAAGVKISIVSVGDKGRGLLSRNNKEQLASVITGTFGPIPPNFSVAACVAGEVLEDGAEMAGVNFNKFQSVMTQVPTCTKVPSYNLIANCDEDPFQRFETEDERAEILESFAEFNLAVTIYGAMLENNTSEVASKMAAMDNATRNANDMFDKLSLKYNKARQAAITTELIEIISGAESLKG